METWRGSVKQGEEAKRAVPGSQQELVLKYSILGIMLTIAFWLLPAYIYSEMGEHMLDTVFRTRLRSGIRPTLP